MDNIYQKIFDLRASIGEIAEYTSRHPGAKSTSRIFRPFAELIEVCQPEHNVFIKKTMIGTLINLVPALLAYVDEKKLPLKPLITAVYVLLPPLSGNDVSLSNYLYQVRKYVRDRYGDDGPEVAAMWEIPNPEHKMPKPDTPRMKSGIRKEHVIKNREELKLLHKDVYDRIDKAYAELAETVPRVTVLLLRKHARCSGPHASEYMWLYH